MSARDTLLEQLSPAQKQEFLRGATFNGYGTFHVRGSAGGEFVVRHGRIYGTRRFLWHKFPESWCISVPGVPPDDRLLAIKLLLETREWYFRWVAVPWRLPLWFLTALVLIAGGIPAALYWPTPFPLVGVFLGSALIIWRMPRV